MALAKSIHSTNTTRKNNAILKRAHIHREKREKERQTETDWENVQCGNNPTLIR